MYIFVIPFDKVYKQCSTIDIQVRISGIQLGYQGFSSWYPKLKTGIVKDTRIPPISNPGFSCLILKK
jgi:hypothetical protein